MNTHAMGVDIGGTKIAMGIVDEFGAITNSHQVATDPGDAAAIDAAIVAGYRRYAAQYQIVALGIAAAGFVSADGSTVSYGTNIAWRDYPLGERIAAQVDAPVRVDNDANAAGWAEYRFGAGRDATCAVTFTVGTGLGGAIISDSHLVRGRWGLAGELGHMRMVPDGLACPCGQSGCMEQYTSGRALVRRTRRAAEQDSHAAAQVLRRGDGTSKGIKGPHITAAALDGDEFAREQIALAGHWIGIAAASIAAILDPQIFIVGGGVCAAGDLLLDPMRAAYRAHLPARTNRELATFTVASLGNDAGIVGAADLARAAR